VGLVPKPEKGWTAYFVELTWPSGGKYPFKFTTAVRVIPDTEPFPSYQPKR
jgi:PhoPQ-activated pathogenicity-related protein